MRAYYKPWKGQNFRTGGLLLMSESAYCWPEDCPKPSHPTKNTVEYWAFERHEDHGREGRYVTALTRALCQEKYPSAERVKAAWNAIAYTIYVQRPLENVRSRPSRRDFIDSGEPFLAVLEKLRPGRVVITGYQAWSSMPDTQMQLGDYKQAYSLKDGFLVWCLAVPHVQSRKDGHRFRWDNIGRRISEFTKETLPEMLAS